MPGREPVAVPGALLDKRRLDALGVLLPIRLHPMSFLPGRHPLGRAGEGMRFLRMRPYERGQDNPRDIDRFSPPGELWINEWDSEVQAAIGIYADVSPSMNVESTAAVRNLAVLQITYSLWRAGDRVRTVLYGSDTWEECAEKNLKSQLERLSDRLGERPVTRGAPASRVLAMLADRRSSAREDLAFLVSDFNEEEEHDREAWRGLLRRVRCEVVPVIVSFELSVKQTGAIKLWDAERNRQCLVLLTPGRARRINAAEAARVAALASLFRSIGMDSLVLRSEHDVYPALAALARTRKKRRI
jgi:uncharacterized protein (DUF58 family)